jgi:hypothetical protein
MLSNHARLGQNGAHTTMTVDHLTLWKMDVLKERVAKNFGLNFSAGAVVRRAIADLFEKSEQWADIESADKLTERQKLEACKKAKPAPQSAAAALDQDDAALMKERGA